MTILGTVLRGIGVLYWLFALLMVGAALYYPKGRKEKALTFALMVLLFGVWPGGEWIKQVRHEAYAREAWAHFRKLCAEKSGEKIYKTFTGVKSVLVVKPLPPATEKDLYDQFWYGDPYSNATAWDKRAESAALRLTGVVKFLPPHEDKAAGFDFIEINYSSEHLAKYELVFSLKDPPFVERQVIERPISRFGVAWDDISTPEDRAYWVAGSRLRVIDLADNSVIAERIGYLIERGFGSRSGGRRPWLAARRGGQTTCPSLRNGDFEDRWFLLTVFQVAEGGNDGK